MLKKLVLVCTLAFPTALGFGVAAQEFPTKPITLVTAFTARRTKRPARAHCR